MSRTEERMKGAYNAARPEDVIGSFDREALWAQINDRIAPVKQNNHVFLRWVSYAAAAVAGMLLMLVWQPRQQQAEQLTAMRSIQTIKPEHTQDIVEIVKAAPMPTVVAAVNATALQKIKVPAATIAAPVLPAPADTLPVATAGNPQQESRKRTDVVHPPLAMQVKHLMDIGNEDRRIIDAGPVPDLQKAAFIRLNRPGGNTDDQQELALRNFFKGAQD